SCAMLEFMNNNAMMIKDATANEDRVVGTKVLRSSPEFLPQNARIVPINRGRNITSSSTPRTFARMAVIDKRLGLGIICSRIDSADFTSGARKNTRVIVTNTKVAAHASRGGIRSFDFFQ